MLALLLGSASSMLGLGWASDADRDVQVSRTAIMDPAPAPSDVPASALTDERIETVLHDGSGRAVRLVDTRVRPDRTADRKSGGDLFYLHQALLI